MTKIYDAIIIGAGHNGLTAAFYLARGGWKTLVLERNECIGGAISRAEVTLPDFIHDLHATNQNPFLGSPVCDDSPRMILMGFWIIYDELEAEQFA